MRQPQLDFVIKLLAVVLLAAAAMPAAVAGGLSLLLAMLLLGRFAFWKPQLGLSRIDIGVMYLGYLAIAAQLLLDGLSPWLHVQWTGNLPVHVFAFGAMGLVIPAMTVRICRGHTGRKVQFEAADKVALWAMVSGFALRVVAPQIDSGHYLLWLQLAALMWFVCFSILGWRYIPMLLRPRVDGKEH